MRPETSKGKTVGFALPVLGILLLWAGCSGKPDPGPPAPRRTGVSSPAADEARVRGDGDADDLFFSGGVNGDSGTLAAKLEQLKRKRFDNPRDTRVLYRLADTYYKLDQPTLARILLEELLEYDPDDTRALLFLADICQRPIDILQDYGKAQAALARACRLMPDNPHFHYLYGECLINQAKYEEATLAYKRCLQLDPGHLDSIYQLGIIGYKTGNYDDALALLERVYRLYPLNSNPRYNMYVVLRAAGRPVDSIAPELRFNMVGSGPLGDAPVHFENVTAEAGLVRSACGRGNGWADIDADGDMDLIVAGSYAPLGLYRNESDGTFTNITEQAGLAKAKPGYSTIFGDYDNDGDEDLFVGRNGWYGASANSLFRNDGTGVFTDVTIESGVADAKRGCFTAAWADYDLDGDIDLFCANMYPFGEIVGTDTLMRNNGDGTFTDVTVEAGLAREGRSCGSVFGDLDNDGDADLLVVKRFYSGYAQTHGLYRNNGDGTFTDITEGSGITGPPFGFVCFTFDYDNDGWLDLFAVNYSSFHDVVTSLETGKAATGLSHNFLYRNLGNGKFQDVSTEAGFARSYGSMSGNFGDIDKDGYLDVFVANGGPIMGRMEPNAMFRNKGDGTFTEISDAVGMYYPSKSHGTGFQDYDQDGDLDMQLVTGGAHIGDHWPQVLYRNSGNSNHWLRVRLEGTRSNRDGIGARVIVRTKELAMHQEVSSGGGFGGTQGLELFFGLGKTDRVESLEVIWPGGEREPLGAMKGDRLILIRQGEGIVHAEGPRRQKR